MSERDWVCKCVTQSMKASERMIVWIRPLMVESDWFGEWEWVDVWVDVASHVNFLWLKQNCLTVCCQTHTVGSDLHIPLTIKYLLYYHLSSTSCMNIQRWNSWLFILFYISYFIDKSIDNIYIYIISNLLCFYHEKLHSIQMIRLPNVLWCISKYHSLFKLRHMYIE